MAEVTVPRLSLILAPLVASVAPAQGLPVLRYDPPANFYRSASTPPEQYSSNAVEGDQLMLQLGSQTPERITTALAQNRLVINTVVYVRSP